MTDIVKRLIHENANLGDDINGYGPPPVQLDAVDEIRRLRAENAKLQHVLKLALEYWAHRQQRYKNRHPAWVIVARAMMGESDE